jgi:hypothetical protein
MGMRDDVGWYRWLRQDVYNEELEAFNAQLSRIMFEAFCFGVVFGWMLVGFGVAIVLSWKGGS